MNEVVTEPGWALAFGAGILSFLSPCMAPLVPGYLSFVSGVSVQDIQRGDRLAMTKVLGASLLFILGFTLVFVMMGTSASFVASFVELHRRLLYQVAGGVMVVMGILVTGLVRIPLLYQERRLNLTADSLGAAGPIVLGMAFAFAWTPCVGPILAAILFYASATETAGRGGLLLFVYSLGMAVPFILSAMAFSRGIGILNWVRRHYAVISALSGAILIGVGVLFLTERWYHLNLLMQRFYYTVIG
jgi:cytochrome c-type biogenesis protein